MADEVSAQSSSQIVYALIPEAVYDHGVIGVYSTEGLARAAAEEIWPQTDGHHTFRIEPRVLDQTFPNAFRYRRHGDDGSKSLAGLDIERASGPAPIEARTL